MNKTGGSSNQHAGCRQVTTEVQDIFLVLTARKRTSITYMNWLPTWGGRTT